MDAFFIGVRNCDKHKLLCLHNGVACLKQKRARLKQVIRHKEINFG
jgi:hypothetical protein